MQCRCGNLVAEYKALGGEERGAFKRTIVRMYTPAFWRLSLLKSIYLLQQLSSPMLLRLLMQAIADPDSGARSLIFACLMGAGAIIGAVAEQHHEMTALEVRARPRLSLSPLSPSICRLRPLVPLGRLRIHPADTPSCCFDRPPRLSRIATLAFHALSPATGRA